MLWKGKHRFVIGMLAIPLALYLIFVISPTLQTFYYSLTDWTGYSSSAPFVGLRNYAKVFGDGVFWKALSHNAIFLLVLPVVTIAIGLFFAFMINTGGRAGRAGVHGVRGAAFYRIVFFFPQVLSVTIIAVLWQQVFRTDDNGLLNSVLIALHLESAADPHLWLSSPTAVLWCIIFVMVWSSIGFYMVLFSAGMQSIPRDIHEAALLDGAGRAAGFLRVTLPLLWDNIQVAWVYLGVAAMDGFALVFIMTPEQGGPNHASEVMGTWIYFTAFERGQPGYASAMAVVMFLITLTLTGLSLRLSRRDRVEQ